MTMGLDMFLTGRKFFWRQWGDREAERREDGKSVTSMDVELAYWRKHPNLHGYMVENFGNGKDDCKEIELSAGNLRTIIAAIKAEALPHTEGFFFGKSDKSGAQRDADVKTFESALDWLEATDKEPFETEPAYEGPGFKAVIVKRKPEAETIKRQRVSRSVHYRGNW